MSIITVAEYHELIEDYPELDTVCLDEVLIDDFHTHKGADTFSAHIANNY